VCRFSPGRAVEGRGPLEPGGVVEPRAVGKAVPAVSKAIGMAHDGSDVVDEVNRSNGNSFVFAQAAGAQPGRHQHVAAGPSGSIRPGGLWRTAKSVAGRIVEVSPHAASSSTMCT
jgi:hypothetical protein